MPSFDITSEANMVALKNAVDVAGRQIGNRYDFKPRLSIRPGDCRMLIPEHHALALRGGLGPAGGIFAPALLANKHRYWLVARPQICSPSVAQSTRVPMNNLG